MYIRSRICQLASHNENVNKSTYILWPLQMQNCSRPKLLTKVNLTQNFTHINQIFRSKIWSNLQYRISLNFWARHPKWMWMLNIT